MPQIDAGRLLDARRLLDAMRLVVRGFGSAEEEVQAVAGNLVDANLSGHDSHGIGMLPRYAAAFLEGGLVPNTGVRTLLDAGTLLRLVGGAGFGQVVGRQAMALAVERARAHGSCIVALGNAHHLGRIGAWAEQAAAAGFVSLHFVNVVARAIVAPHGGSDARLGTNPFCAGIPLPGRPPVIVDFATSVIAQGKTRVAHNRGETVPPGCLIDDQGRPTQDPRYTVVPPLGALLPMAGHKGYGLALACELLGGALAAGATQGADDGSRKRVLNGMLSVVIDPAALAGGATWADEASALLRWVQASPAGAGGPVQVPGEPERRFREQRLAQGVPVDAATWDEILAAARALGVDAAAVSAAAGAGGPAPG